MNTFMDRVNAIVQNNQASMDQDVSYPDAGIGALENVANNVPRQADLMNQPHMLAYINPQEEQMLRDMGGAGIPGPDNIPVYGFWDSVKSFFSGDSSSTSSTNSRNTGGRGSYTGTATTSTPIKLSDPYKTTAVPDTNYVVGSGGNISGKNISGKNISTLVKPTATTTSGDNSGNSGVTGYTASPITVTNLPTVVTNPVVTDPQPIKDSIDVVSAEDFKTKSTGSNSLYETVANMLTPFDNTTYVGGNLMDNTTEGPATNVGTKTYYGTVGQANTAENDDFPVEGFGALQATKDEGPLSNAYDYIKSTIPATVAGALVPGAGMFLTGANALGAYQVGPNPRDVITGTGEDGQEIRQNADGRYYSKGMLGNYYFVDGPTDSTPVSESNQSSANDAMMAANDKSNNKSAGTGSYAGTLASGGGGGGNSAAANSIFNRYYKGGSGFGLPPWLQIYASGTSFDKVLSKTTIDGKEYYETPDGQYLDAAEVDSIIVNATVTPET